MVVKTRIVLKFKIYLGDWMVSLTAFSTVALPFWVRTDSERVKQPSLRGIILAKGEFARMHMYADDVI